jgi:predicted dehydrogenase
MTPVAFSIIGAGWRAEFFMRVARALPDRFRVAGVLVRDPSKREAFSRTWATPCVADIETLSRSGFGDFSVVSVPQPVAPEVISKLAELGVPILTETPPATKAEGLRDIWNLVQAGARIQVAEQYIYQPLHAARLNLVRSGRIGEPTFAHVSSCHGYHGTSLIRHYLGTGFGAATVRARAFEAPIVAGPDRRGPPTGEVISRSRQVIAELDFGDRLGIYDFTSDQYFSWIRSLSVLVRGSRGEVRDEAVRYLERYDDPTCFSLCRVDKGANGNLEGLWHRGITGGAEWLYRNPFPYAPLSDDEVAVATVLDGMAHFVRTGAPVYSLADAAQDQLLALAIEESLRTGSAVKVEPGPWAQAAPSHAFINARAGSDG